MADVIGNVGALLRSEHPSEAAIAMAAYKTETTLSDFIDLLLSAWPEVNADADTVHPGKHLPVPRGFEQSTGVRRFVLEFAEQSKNVGGIR